MLYVPHKEKELVYRCKKYRKVIQILEPIKQNLIDHAWKGHLIIEWRRLLMTIHKAYCWCDRKVKNQREHQERTKSIASASIDNLLLHIWSQAYVTFIFHDIGYVNLL